MHKVFQVLANLTKMHLLQMPGFQVGMTNTYQPGF